MSQRFQVIYCPEAKYPQTHWLKAIRIRVYYFTVSVSQESRGGLSWVPPAPGLSGCNQDGGWGPGRHASSLSSCGRILLLVRGFLRSLPRGTLPRAAPNTTRQLASRRSEGETEREGDPGGSRSFVSPSPRCHPITFATFCRREESRGVPPTPKGEGITQGWVIWGQLEAATSPCPSTRCQDLPLLAWRVSGYRGSAGLCGASKVVRESTPAAGTPPPRQLELVDKHPSALTPGMR